MKMSFHNSGVYRIDRATLSNMGFDPLSIDPQNIAIYGNGGGMIPQDNETERPNDLVENSILVIGENDGIFNSDDYILFYVDEVDKHSYNPNSREYSVENNLYTDEIFYFITVKETPGKRVLSKIDLGDNHPKIEYYDRIIWHEQDLVNILGSGREWFGEQFDASTPLNFDIPFGNLVPDKEISVVLNLMAQAFIPSSVSVDLGSEAIEDVQFDPIINARYTPKGDTQRASFTIGTEGLQDLERLELLYNSGGSTSAVAYLNNYLITAPTILQWNSVTTKFRSAQSTLNPISTFSISGHDENMMVWDVTNPMQPQVQEFSVAGNIASFGAFSDELSEYIIFDPDDVTLVSTYVGISNQNLHRIIQTDLLIVSHSDFVTQANRLAEFRQSHDGLNVTVVTTEEIYNEFGSGKPDPSAIRDFVKYIQDNGGLDYLLFFGKGSYDYKDRFENNTNFVPTYEARNSLDPLASYSSDDFFGFLDSDEGEWIESRSGDHLLDIGIGRIPATSLEEATIAIDKIISYQTSSDGLGNWRTKLLFVADDGDNNIHQRDADQLATLVDTSYKQFNVDKLYLDSFEQERRPNGEFSPDAQRALLDAVDQGVLVLNFTGHGGETGWMQERVLTLDLIDDMENQNNLPLFVTATCEFGRNDDPNIVSGAEIMMFKENGGAIALITTARPVFSSTNYDLNLALYGSILERENGQYARLGDVIRFTKNNSLNGSLNRNFILLGDPSMQLAYPEKQVVITEINESNQADTIKSMEKVRLTGEIQENGLIDQQFSGILSLTLFDKSQQTQTRGTESSVFFYEQRNSALFNGTATVTNGQFSVEFVVPKNIDYRWGNGKFTLYAVDTSRNIDAIGSKSDFTIGGTNNQPTEDNSPPKIRIFLNDTLFSDPYSVKPNATLLVNLSDENGINISQASIGQEITATLNDSAVYILNPFFTTNLDDFTQGWVEFPLRNVPEGLNHLTIKAWDNYNNSSISTLEFIIDNESSTLITDLSNFPNPFLNSTTFSIVHNGAGEEIEMTVDIYNSKGEKITSLYRILEQAKSVEKIIWNGDSFEGSKLGKGIYIYNVRLKSLSTGKIASERQKLIISN